MTTGHSHRSHRRSPRGRWFCGDRLAPRSVWPQTWPLSTLLGGEQEALIPTNLRTTNGWHW